MIIFLLSLVLIVLALLVIDTLNYRMRLSKRVYDGEYTQRFITNKRNGYNDGIR